MMPVTKNFRSPAGQKELDFLISAVDYIHLPEDNSKHGEVVMIPARKFAAEEFMQERTALEERVDHIQQDLADLKADFRRLVAKVDAVNGKVDAMKHEMTALRIGMKDSTAALRTGMKDSTALLLAHSVEGLQWSLMYLGFLGVILWTFRSI